MLMYSRSSNDNIAWDISVSLIPDFMFIMGLFPWNTNLCEDGMCRLWDVAIKSTCLTLHTSRGVRSTVV